MEDAGHAGAVQQRIVHLAEDRRRLAIREVVRLQLAERPPGHRAHDDHSLGDAVEHRFGDLPATGGGGAQRTVHLEEIRHLDPKSSSSVIVSANSSTSAGGLASAVIGMRPTSFGAIHASTARSRSTRLRMRGRCTLTMTRVPSTSRASCPWAMEAAGGLSVEWAKRSSSGPNSVSTRSRIADHRSGGTWSRHIRHSATSASGKTPSPAAMSCASLM